MRQRFASSLLCMALAGASSTVLANSPAPVAPSATAKRPAPAADLARWQAQAANVEIMRDQWGVAHVFGKTDADAVFGALYAQAEDDFHRIEMNYVGALGRMAEVEGEAALMRDLRQRLYISPEKMQAQYAESPAWLKTLMNAFADGLNYYLHTHQDVTPRLITRFEPWMALAFSEGSIGGDIESIDLAGLERMYGQHRLHALASTSNFEPEPRGSNGFAIAPKRATNGRALLMINPHTSFYFRPELHMASNEGLNAYGAVTWGQFFIYQGFNERLGWMHTSGGGDVIDEYLETVTQRDGKWFYRYGDGQRQVREVVIALKFRNRAGETGTRAVTVYFTHHGPVIRSENGKWVSVRMMDEPLKALTQSFLRTKARNYAGFVDVMQLRTNSSNNTVYADADGNIAYFHGNFIPRRDPRFDWSRPVDGSNPATEWQGLHEVKDTITLLNPDSGYIANTNNWPCSAAGASSPDCAAYPAYMWSLPENARGRNATRVFDNSKKFDIQSLTAAAYDTYLSAFDPLLPALRRDFAGLPALDARRQRLKAPVELLANWNQRYALDSIATTLAIYWGQQMLANHTPEARAARIPAVDYISQHISGEQRLVALEGAIAKLEKDFGTWRTPWGEINRFQRLSGDIELAYDDDKPSIPVPFPSATWGSLASFGMSAPQKTRRIYGDRGNSFVAAVEFGPKVRAHSILAGGQSSDPTSPHFVDQAQMYAQGQFKQVLFYRDEVERGAARRYRPGQ